MAGRQNVPWHFPINSDFPVKSAVLELVQRSHYYPCSELEICEPREELSSLRPAKAAERSKTLTSPPQPLLAPAKFKAGLNFHLVNSFVNRPGGNSVSVNISFLVFIVLLALEEATRHLRR